MRITEDDKKRFLSKISFGFGSNACWTWMGGISTRDGRGRFWVDGDTRTASSVSFNMFIGKIPFGMFVCHKCDNPSCVNPNHFFLGTPLDNMRDMISKGRKVIRMGGDSKMSTISDEDARVIIGMYNHGEKQKDIASRFGMSQSNISRIVNGNTFKNIRRES